MDFSTGWINGRTLNKSILSTGANHSFGKFSPTERVPIELPRDLYALGAELVHATPFVVGRNTFVTAHDFDRLQTIFEFANFRFTENALKSAAKEVTSDPLTIDLERRGDLHTESAPANAFEFSQQVCIWGAGQRVWGNLTRHYSRNELSAKLDDWFLKARKEMDPHCAISHGTTIRGLGVSFASKHLRLLKPTEFVVLDDVISQGFGYALNAAGYSLFIADLRRLQQEHFPNMRIADLEAGLFVLIRQFVRSK